MDGVVALLTEDAWIKMPPQPYEYQGHAAIGEFLSSRPIWRGARNPKLVPTRSNGRPAFAYYLPTAAGDRYLPHGLLVLDIEGDRITTITRLALAGLADRFGLPPVL